MTLLGNGPIKFKQIGWNGLSLVAWQPMVDEDDESGVRTFCISHTGLCTFEHLPPCWANRSVTVVGKKLAGRVPNGLRISSVPLELTASIRTYRFWNFQLQNQSYNKSDRQWHGNLLIDNTQSIEKHLNASQSLKVSIRPWYLLESNVIKRRVRRFESPCGARFQKQISRWDLFNSLAIVGLNDR